MYKNVHRTIFYRTPTLQTTQMSINKRIDVCGVMYSYNGMQSRNRKEWSCVMCNYMNLPLSYCVEQNKWDTLAYTVWFHLRKPQKGNSKWCGMRESAGKLEKSHISIWVWVPGVLTYVKLPCSIPLKCMHFKQYVHYISRNWLRHGRQLYPGPTVLLGVHENVFISSKVRKKVNIT